MLTLPIKKKWFDMILSGEKKEEYREIKPYYASRFYNEKNYENDWFFNERILNILLRNGYSKNSPTIKCLIKLSIDEGKEEWGAKPFKSYFVLKILSVEKVDDK